MTILLILINAWELINDKFPKPTTKYEVKNYLLN